MQLTFKVKVEPNTTVFIHLIKGVTTFLKLSPMFSWHLLALEKWNNNFEFSMYVLRIRNVHHTNQKLCVYKVCIFDYSEELYKTKQIEMTYINVITFRHQCNTPYFTISSQLLHAVPVNCSSANKFGIRLKTCIWIEGKRRIYWRGFIYKESWTM